MAGLSIFFMALGAILMFAVTGNVEGINIDVVGFVLIVVGIIGLITHLVRRPGIHSVSERVVSSDGRHVVEEHHSEV